MPTIRDVSPPCDGAKMIDDRFPHRALRGTVNGIWRGGKKRTRAHKSLLSTTAHVNYCDINEEEKLLLIRRMKTRAQEAALTA